MTKGCVLVGLASISLATLGAGCSGGKGDQKASTAQKDAAAVLINASDVIQARARLLETGVSFSGELVPQSVTEITAAFIGDLQEVRAREGQSVHKGQRLAVFKPRDMKDTWKAAEAGVLSAQAGLFAAKNAEERAKRLLEAGAVAPSDVDAATAARTASEAQLRSAEAMSGHAKENAERLDVPAPISGSISQVFVHTGDHTAIGDKLFTLVDTDTLELSATFPSEALSRINIGTPIRFHIDAFPDELFEGRVDRINPTTEPGTRQIRVYSRIPNRDGRLVGGLFAGGRLVTARKEDAVCAPMGVLRREGADQVVYRVREGKAQRLSVQTGLIDEEGGQVELVGAVAVGDSLLMGVTPGLQDGAKVRVLATNGDTNGGGANSSGGANNTGGASNTGVQK